MPQNNNFSKRFQEAIRRRTEEKVKISEERKAEEIKKELKRLLASTAEINEIEEIAEEIKEVPIAVEELTESEKEESRKRF